MVVGLRAAVAGLLLGGCVGPGWNFAGPYDEMAAVDAEID